MKQKTIESYLAQHAPWRDILDALRSLLLDTELEESLKWGIPVYSLNGKNVVGIGAFKSYAGLWFFQGTFLSDPEGLLINAQEGKTKAMRQMRFSSQEELNPSVVQAYILEAIQNQKEGKEIKASLRKPLILPGELDHALEQDPQLKEAFAAFNMGKRREFADYISEAKHEETRKKRLEKIIPLILNGMGLHDKYR